MSRSPTGSPVRGEPMNYTCRILEAVVEDDLGEVHATYPVEVTLQMDRAVHGRSASYCLNKRYKSFEDLNKRLTNLFRKDVLPKLPTKSWGRNMDADFLEGRRASLQEYLECVLQLGAGHTEVVLGFLNLEPILQVVPRLSEALDTKVRLYDDSMAVVSQLKHANSALTVEQEQSTVAIEALRKVLDSTIAEHNSVLKASGEEKSQLREELAQQELGMQLLGAQLEQTKADLEQTRADLAQTKGNLEQTEAVLEQTEGVLEQTEGVLEQTKGDLAKLHQERSSLEGALDESQAVCSRLEAECASRKAELEHSRQLAAELTATHEKEQQEAAHTLQSSQRAVEELERARAELRALIEEAEAQLEESRGECEQMETDLSVTRSELDEANSVAEEAVLVAERMTQELAAAKVVANEASSELRTSQALCAEQQGELASYAAAELVLPQERAAREKAEHSVSLLREELARRSEHLQEQALDEHHGLALQLQQLAHERDAAVVELEKALGAVGRSRSDCEAVCLEGEIMKARAAQDRDRLQGMLACVWVRRARDHLAKRAWFKALSELSGASVPQAPASVSQTPGSALMSAHASMMSPAPGSVSPVPACAPMSNDSASMSPAPGSVSPALGSASLSQTPAPASASLSQTPAPASASLSQAPGSASMPLASASLSQASASLSQPPSSALGSRTSTSALQSRLSACSERSVPSPQPITRTASGPRRSSMAGILDKYLTCSVSPATSFASEDAATPVHPLDHLLCVHDPPEQLCGIATIIQEHATEIIPGKLVVCAEAHVWAAIVVLATKTSTPPKGNQTSNCWVSDEQIKQCLRCDAKFTWTNRRHHCRQCGQIFCHKCCGQFAKLPCSPSPVRVCIGCAPSCAVLNS